MTKQRRQKKIRRIKIKNYKNQLKTDMFDLENELNLTPMGNAKLECKIGDVTNVYSRFDTAKNRTITNEFYDYLMQEMEIVPNTRPLDLYLNVNKNTTKQQEKNLIKAIKSTFAFEITSISLKIKRSTIVAALFYLGGALSFFINTMLDKFMHGFTGQEILFIATWFFVWEATNIAFFDRRELVNSRYNMLRIYNSNMQINKPE